MTHRPVRSQLGTNSKAELGQANKEENPMSTSSLFSKDNLVAWCIVPFDANKRNPKQRAEMLQRLRLKALAYDWREEYVPTFDEEVTQLRRHGIRMVAFWWSAEWQSEPYESPTARRSLEFFQRNDLKLKYDSARDAERTK